MKTLLLSIGLLGATHLIGLAQKVTPAPVGVQLYSFRNQFAKDVPGTMAKVREMGFREVELAGTYGLSNAEFKKLLDQNGLKAISTGAAFERLETDVPGIIREAKEFGARYVSCAWIPHPGDSFTQFDADRAVEVFNTAGKLLAQNGLTFCYHIHGYEFQKRTDGSTYFDYLAKNLDPKYVNFELDVFWAKMPGEDPVALLQKYPKRFLLSHLKDRKPGTPGAQNGRADVETNVTLGQGDIGIAEFMKAARKAGVRHHFIEDESSRSMEQVPQSVAFLRENK
ncbi:TIM barrel protein [Rudanella paleaurantiibacter]|uniref:TIM barrel protein n=1 Tax=Rudanella paleaurantiibacter TaxID=2614655 RepID=A0A7J5TXC7_9BACT|nr:sugar phosphate isomerase/epimerase [Rudanella paleaurantiibacter]KAB7729083.1 TIM barrel protein [Rudanella paleaurantiibacter]